MDRIDDARGVITGPMWAREEAARRNLETLDDMAHIAHWLLWACALVLGAYLLAAWLDDTLVHVPDAGGCTVVVEGR